MPEEMTLEEIDAQIADLEGQITQAQQGGQAPDYSAFFKSPGYDFRFDEGIRALDRSAASQGKLMSGGMMRELERYGQGLATSEFGNYANRLATLAGIGQTGTQGLPQTSTGSQGAIAGQLGQSIMSGGTARALGIMGQNNALQQGIGGAVSSINQMAPAISNFGAQQGWWGDFDPSTGITWNTGRQF